MVTLWGVVHCSEPGTSPHSPRLGTQPVSQTRLCTGGPAPERQLCTRARPLGHGRLRAQPSGCPALAWARLRGPGHHGAGGRGLTRQDPAPAGPAKTPGPGTGRGLPELGRQKLSWTAAGSRVGTGGRGAGRAWLDPGRPPSERKACPRCPRAPPQGSAEVREAGAMAAQAQTIRDSSGDRDRPGRRAARVLVIGYGRAGELRQRVLDTH